MKIFLILAALLCTTVNAYADVPPVRFQKEYARIVYDTTVDGGQSTTHASVVTLPAGIIITDLFVYVNKLFTSSGTSSVALQCVGSQDLMAYQDLTSAALDDVIGRRLLPTAPGASAYIPAGAVGTQVALTGGGSVLTDCIVTTQVRANAGDTALTAGKFTAIIEYFRK